MNSNRGLTSRITTTDKKKKDKKEKREYWCECVNLTRWYECVNLELWMHESYEMRWENKRYERKERILMLHDPVLMPPSTLVPTWIYRFNTLKTFWSR
jgi:hypothetical protein